MGQLPCDKVHFEHQEGFFHVEKPTKDILNFEELCQAKSLIYTDDTGKKFCFGKPELRKPEDKLTTGKCAALPPGEAEVTADGITGWTDETRKSDPSGDGVDEANVSTPDEKHSSFEEKNFRKTDRRKEKEREEEFGKKKRKGKHN